MARRCPSHSRLPITWMHPKLSSRFAATMHENSFVPFSRTDFTTEPRFVDLVGDSKRRGTGLPMLRATQPLHGFPSQGGFPNEQDQVVHRVARAFGILGQRRDELGGAIIVEIDPNLLAGSRSGRTCSLSPSGSR